MNEESFYFYMVTDKINGILITGITDNLSYHIKNRKEEKIGEFIKKYAKRRLVYYKKYSNLKDARLKQKQLKEGGRNKKMELICKKNPYWFDLYKDIEYTHCFS